MRRASLALEVAVLVIAAAVPTGCGARTGLTVTTGVGDADAGASGSSGSGDGSLVDDSSDGGGDASISSDSGDGSLVDDSSDSGEDAPSVMAAEVASVSAGYNHACAVTRAGAAMCWGHNANGELGNDSTTDSPVPVGVMGLSSGVIAIAAGSGHTCALDDAGAVKCWGWNTFGQLGNGAIDDSHVPVGVVGLSSGVIAIAAGNGYTCAVTAGGAVKCWGVNVRPGGDVPVDVPGLSPGVVAVSLGAATGDEQACVVTSAGAAQCWGSDVEGQLGNGALTNGQVPAPVGVMGLSSGVRSISAGDSYTCSVTIAGTVECWGANVGLFTGPQDRGSDVPLDVAGFSSGVEALSAGGGGAACVVTTAGAAQCWGENGVGQLGDNSTTSSLVPVDVVGLSSGVLAISAGSNYACAATVAGALECWGGNEEGQLGNGSTIPSLVPVDVVGL